MKRPKLEDYKPSEIYDGHDMAVWYREYYLALEKYADHLEQMNSSNVIHNVSESEVFENYGKPFTSGRDLWDFLSDNYDFTPKT